MVYTVEHPDSQGSVDAHVIRLGTYQSMIIAEAICLSVCHINLKMARDAWVLAASFTP